MQTTCKDFKGSGVLVRTSFTLVLCVGFNENTESSNYTGATFFLDYGAGVPSYAIPVVGDRPTAWCQTSGDNGQLVGRFEGSAPNFDSDLGQSWGLCMNKPRLPGCGYDYLEKDLKKILLRNTLESLESFAGRGVVPLKFIQNRAGRYDGMILEEDKLFSNMES